MLNLRFWRNPDLTSPATRRQASGTARPHSLSQARTGAVVRINGFGTLSAAQRQHLQAYGLLQGRTVQVLAQKPVTIVLVEQTELAFETEIACQVQID
jgi:Fe2+ transport system protein FeoA